MQSRLILRGAQGSRVRRCLPLKFPRSTNHRKSAKELGSTSLKYYHPWKIIIIMLRLFFIISKILSCRRKVPRMTVLNSSSSYHLLSARGCNMLPQGMSNSISNRALEDLLGSKSINYGSMVCVYG